jgi:hypothetical protein
MATLAPPSWLSLRRWRCGRRRSAPGRPSRCRRAPRSSAGAAAVRAGVAQDQVGHHFQRFQVEIGLVEAIEKHQAVAPAASSFGHVRHRAEVRAELHGHGDMPTAAFTALSPDRCIAAPPVRRTSPGHRDVVDVQLQRVGAGLLHLVWRSFEPAAHGRAVQAGDHRDIHGLLAFARCAPGRRPGPL